jgi:hypothetical protein
MNKCYATQYIRKMSKQVELMKFQTEIYQLITLDIDTFHENKEIFFKNSSQTAHMYVIKLDINHLK